MLGIILTGHGGFASGMEKAMKQILGEQSAVYRHRLSGNLNHRLLTSQLEQAVRNWMLSKISCF
jgi:PTS system N-acetylgalactosamine-specific IIA component